MLVLGLLLLLLAVALFAVGLFLTEGSDLELAGQGVDPVALFLLGAVSVAALGVGLLLVRAGTRRGLRHRRERKQLEELHTKLDRVESDRSRETDRGGDPTA